MSELSKTAKASMVKEAKKERVEESIEEAIRQIRIDRAAKLFVVRQDRVDKLLAAYDKLLQQIDRFASIQGESRQEHDVIMREILS